MGEWSDALRRSLEKRAPVLLQALKDDRTGKKPLKATQRQAAMALLRKVMTAREIAAKLSSVPEGKKGRAK